jgi:hypothetical protein
MPMLHSKRGGDDVYVCVQTLEFSPCRSLPSTVLLRARLDQAACSAVLVVPLHPLCGDTSLFSVELTNIYRSLEDDPGDAANDLLKKLHQARSFMESEKVKIQPWHLCAFKCHGCILATRGS